MTTRRWMIAVVIVGLAMGGIQLTRRHIYFLFRVRFHTEAEALFRSSRDKTISILRSTEEQQRSIEEEQRAGVTDFFAGFGGTNAIETLKAEQLFWRKDLAQEDQAIPYHAAMARKYRHAARYPWLPVEPDPPNPAP
jgi:hypothetical protein